MLFYGSAWSQEFKMGEIKGRFKPLRLTCYCCGSTIEYSCPSVYLSWCLCVCAHDNSKNNGSIHLKLENIVAYENYLDKFDIGHCLIKVKVKA